MVDDHNWEEACRVFWHEQVAHQPLVRWASNPMPILPNREKRGGIPLGRRVLLHET